VTPAALLARVLVSIFPTSTTAAKAPSTKAIRPIDRLLILVD
jgi:hypothetical protein